MKRIILFKEGFFNFIKVGMHFHGTDEDMWTSVVDGRTLDNFMRANLIQLNRFGHILVDGEVWGVIQ